MAKTLKSLWKRIRPPELPGITGITRDFYTDRHGASAEQITVQGRCEADDIEFNRTYVVRFGPACKVKVFVKSITVDKSGGATYYAQDIKSIEDQYTIR